MTDIPAEAIEATARAMRADYDDLSENAREWWVAYSSSALSAAYPVLRRAIIQELADEAEDDLSRAEFEGCGCPDASKPQPDCPAENAYGAHRWLTARIKQETP